MTVLAQAMIATGSFLGGVLAIWAGLAWTNPSVPPVAEVTGFSGNAGEWEITATVALDGDSRELSGPMKMSHVGWCSVEGAQEKAGHLRLRMHRLFAGLDATVTLDGVECTFEGSLSDAYVGKMKCPGRRPVQMLMWVR